MSATQQNDPPSSVKSTAEVAVLAYGYEPLGLFPGEGASASRLAVAGDEAEGAALTGRLAAALGAARHVIVVRADWLDADALHRLRTARAALDTPRLALVPTDAPPLAGAVLTALLASLSEHVDAGRLVAALPRVTDELGVLAWVRKVSGLTRPSPSLGQHVASLVPRRGFGVQIQPEPFVRRLNPDKETPIARAPEASELILADRDGDVTWATEVVNPALGRLRVSEVDATERGPEWWGTDRLTEIVVHPTDLPALAVRATTGLALRRCGWCDTRIAARECPFCGNTAMG